MSEAADAAASIGHRPRHDASAPTPENLPVARYRADPGLSSFAKAFHVFWIVGQVFGKAFHRTGKIAGEIVTGDVAGRSLLAERFLQSIPHELGFRHTHRPGLGRELGQEVIGQFQRNRLHSYRVIRAVPSGNTREPAFLGTSLWVLS